MLAAFMLLHRRGVDTHRERNELQRTRAKPNDKQLL